jgi:NAD(P)-dependent dehydrogenase (short-subunit alcohol dehydrogenase family)
MNSTASPTVVDWKADRLSDLTGKTYLITGANSGIGYEAAAHLRRANADVIVAARSLDKGKAAVAELARFNGAGELQLVQLDLASLDSIRQANDDVRGPVGETQISDAAQDEAAGTRLWSLSEELLDITFDVS